MAVSGAGLQWCLEGAEWGKGLRWGGREERVSWGGLGRDAVCAERQNGARRSFACRRHDGPRGGVVAFHPVLLSLFPEVSVSFL